VHRSFVPGFSEIGPYALAWIELPEQRWLRVLGNVTDCPIEDVEIGMPVEVWFEKRGGFSLPNFRIIRPLKKSVGHAGAAGR
jgi:uncharacterized OB-fold protein